MAKKYGFIDENDFVNIASAIREKNGTSTKYSPSDMPAAIRAISTLPEISQPVNVMAIPGTTVTVPAGYYTQDSEVEALLAIKESEIGDIIKTSGITETITPGSSKTLYGQQFYTSDSIITASLAKTEAQIDSTLKATGSNETIAPGESKTVNGGKFYTTNNVISASLATSITLVDDAIKESKIETAPLRDEHIVTPSDGKLLSSVTILAPDMSDATAEATDIKLGKKAYVNGRLIEGTYVPTSSDGGGNIDISDATATADDILEGKTAYTASGLTQGRLKVVRYYSSSSAPTTDLGEAGDIYIQTV